MICGGIAHERKPKSIDLWSDADVDAATCYYIQLFYYLPTDDGRYVCALSSDTWLIDGDSSFLAKHGLQL